MFSNSGRFYKIAYGIILVLLILFLLSQVNYIIKPLKTIFNLVFVPIFLGGFLYYLLRPMVKFIEKKVQSKILAIVITFVSIIVLITTILYFGGSLIRTQMADLLNNYSVYLESALQKLNHAFANREGYLSIMQEFNLRERLTSSVENVLNAIRNNFVGFFSTVTNIGTVLVLIPFVLFYFLKDDNQLYQTMLGLFPKEKKNKAALLLREIDETLATYIGGQLIVALILGLLTFIGYLIIGLPNAVILALIATLTSFIPFLGPMLGIIPAIFVGISSGTWMVLQIIIVLFIVQQIEGNVLQPKIQGDRMNIHPLLVIFLVLIFITLFGFLGSLFAVPVYAVLRELVRGLNKHPILK